MDLLKNCILLRDKKTGDFQDRTESIRSIREDEAAHTYTINFKSGTFPYRYNFGNAIWLKDPIVLEPKTDLIYACGKLQKDVKAILRFKDWHRLQFEDGSFLSVPPFQLKIVHDHKDDFNCKSFIEYLLDITESIDAPEGQPEKEGFLHKELRTLSIFDDSVLFDFIADKPVQSRKANTDFLLLPFQANKSQIQAIRNALTHNISVIQGPPGTGKTQTILNLIANLIYCEKTVAVVSGNNEAIRNVSNKLENEDLGFFGATFGNKENIENFFDTKHPVPNLEEASSSEVELFKNSFTAVQQIYEAREEIASIQNQLFEIKAEYRNFMEQFQSRTVSTRIPVSEKNILPKLRFLQSLAENGTIGFLDKLKLFFRFSSKVRKVISRDLGSVLTAYQEAFYRSRIAELENRREQLQKFLQKEDMEKSAKDLQKTSRKLLLSSLAKRIDGDGRTDFSFTKGNYKAKFDSFLQRFPLVYSTTNSLRYCSQENYRYDYVLVDESSQINLATAAIAMACAKNIVFVGDPMQLPHIVRTVDHPILKGIFQKYHLPQYDDYEKNSILDGIQQKYQSGLPFTLLNIHYRCDPEIIGFCNKMFYGDKLLINRSHQEGNGIHIFTHDGHYCVHRANDREVDIIRKEILPNVKSTDIGIIAPYRNQVESLKRNFPDCQITIDTVHKFQGKERNVIILSATSDKLRIQEGEERSDFLNDPNLINVAISRAKDVLYVVASKFLFEQKGILSSLKDYVLYYSDFRQSTMERSAIRSIFDLLYKDGVYDPEHIKSKLKQVSEFQSENLIATLLDKFKKQEKVATFDYVHNYPLRLLLDADMFEDIEDRKFILNPNSHVDFLLFNPIGKRPLFVIEVDGKQHRMLAQQAERDRRKDRILSSVGLKVLRLKTTDSDCEEKIKEFLRNQGSTR